MRLVKDEYNKNKQLIQVCKQTTQTSLLAITVVSSTEAVLEQAFCTSLVRWFALSALSVSSWCKIWIPARNAQLGGHYDRLAVIALPTPFVWHPNKVIATTNLYVCDINIFFLRNNKCSSCLWNPPPPPKKKTNKQKTPLSFRISNLHWTTVSLLCPPTSYSSWVTMACQDYLNIFIFSL